MGACKCPNGTSGSADFAADPAYNAVSGADPDPGPEDFAHLQTAGCQTQPEPERRLALRSCQRTLEGTGVSGRPGEDPGRAGVLARVGLWPKQWSAARMFANTAKGFHVHPPSIPKDSIAADWLRRVFVDEPKNYSLRRYEEEQWDVMFFLQGRIEVILCDVRAGFARRVMRFFVDGDNYRSNNNVGIVIPPGVAHAIRVEGTEDVIMVYGTSTVFQPEFEGRIASEIETAELPKTWQEFLREK